MCFERWWVRISARPRFAFLLNWSPAVFFIWAISYLWLIWSTSKLKPQTSFWLRLRWARNKPSGRLSETFWAKHPKKHISCQDLLSKTTNEDWPDLNQVNLSQSILFISLLVVLSWNNTKINVFLLAMFIRRPPFRSQSFFADLSFGFSSSLSLSVSISVPFLLNSTPLLKANTPTIA